MKNKKIKIVTIGGGSSYTPELIEGFIKRSNELPIKEIWLVDIEEGKEKLEIVGTMAQRMVKAAGLDWKVNLTLDRRQALEGADFVSTQFRVGLLDARIKDERIPLSHGLIGQETNGAGGMLKAFRTIPVILDIIEDMKELCPNAWLINFTNPAGMITEAAIKYGGWNKTVGLCNVPINLMKQDSKALEIAEEDLFFKFAGLNHYIAAKGMLQLMKSMEQITISAAITGNYDEAVHAFTINPLVPSGQVSKEVLDELLAAHKKYLPQFAEITNKLDK